MNMVQIGFLDIPRIEEPSQEKCTSWKDVKKKSETEANFC